MAEALYLKDCYLKEFEAEVKGVNNEKYIVLDKTAFYPQSGGQPFDVGTITRLTDQEKFNVVYVGKFNNQISHEVDKPGLKSGDKIKAEIDWERRYILMRYHTAAHVLSAVIHRDTGALITGNQLSLEKGRIDFNLEKFDREQIKQFEKEANELIEQAHDVGIDFIPRQEALKIPTVFRLAKALPESIKTIRLISLGGFDQQACGGTHVKNTKEIKSIEVIGAENKGKNNRRIYFKLK